MSTNSFVFDSRVSMMDSASPDEQLFFNREKIIKLMEIQKTIEDILQYDELTQVDSNNNNSLNEVIKNIKIYIMNNCHHNWINDAIDIDLDNSMNITYCEICLNDISAYGDPN